MSTLRICLAARSPFLGGAEVACERLAVGLVEAGHEVVVLTGFENEVAERFRLAGLDCRVYDLPMRDKWKLPRYLNSRHRLRKFFRAFQPDIIHSNDLPTHQIVSSAAVNLNIPRVCHHRFVYDKNAIDWMNRAGAEQHVFVSRYLMETLQQASPRLARQTGCVLYDGLPLTTVPSADARLRMRQQLGLPADKVIVLYAGQIVERKGVSDLIKAWSLLAHPVREMAELLIVGDDIQHAGAYRQAMEQLAAELGVVAQFKGFRKDVPAWLTASDLAVVPSRIEPLGNATLEAMAYGLPVIGGDTGGIPEMIVDNETGWLSPVADSPALAALLTTAIKNRAEREKMGRNGRQRCETLFSLQAHVRSAVEVYSSVRVRVE
ncbi:Spore coat protein SA [Rosistilla ulvae]|uniref:Spore coat protein SA n=1 Tax=Rosistilla ulvae TaxID=1930277 RepID=A0A517M0C3_9BACT|nr:glycosyltransferase family 4 protein [Rosistilla ulvae]QDS88338.1 Spore coat protein SA [Rosistilla ulvae]